MDNNNRNALLLAFILLALGGLAMANNAALVIMILIGLLFVVRQFDQNTLKSYSERSSNYDDYEDYDFEEDREWDDISNQTRQAQSEPIYRHALEAVTRAGLDPDNVQVLTVDVGLMTFTENDEPAVYRTWSLPDNVDYIQPFVQLRLPTKAQGRVKFELMDSAGNPVFIHEDIHNLERGRNFVTPSARLPIHDQREMDGKWQLRVSADGVLLAVHRFSFAESTNDSIQRHIGEDGEINTELRAAMTENRLPRMSLDDLLSFQEDEDSSQQQKSS